MDAYRLETFFSEKSRIAILIHRNPDGDALGSALAIRHFLSKWYHKRNKPVTIDIISPSLIAYFLEWLPGASEVIRFPESPERARQIIREADSLIYVDFNAPNRIDELSEELELSTVPVVLIDHHREPQVEPAISYWNPEAASSAQLAWKFIKDFNETDLIDKNIAECIYTGIMTDTGSFRFRSVTPEVHRIVAELLEYGVDPDKVYSLIYHRFSLRRLQFFGHSITFRIRHLPEFRTTYMAIPAEDLVRFNIGPGETEGLVNYTLAIEGTRLGVLMIDRTRENQGKPMVRFSFRSKGNVHVDEFARKFFNGGGHHNAAGGVLYTTLDEAETYFLQKLSSLLPVLVAENEA